MASTLRYAREQTGLVRGARVLALTNQERGFDCPGCAWPEAPPTARGRVEFCENGAKAVLSEATTRRVDRAFFAQSTVAELAGQSDAWLNDQGRIAQPMVLRPGSARYEPIDWDDAFALDRTRAPVPGRRPTRPSSTRRGARATRRRSSTSSSSARSGPTTCRTARTCATSRAARGSRRPSASARAPCSSRTSSSPTPSSSSGRTPGPTTRACSRPSRRQRSAAR